tara:strand:- start:9197 stop:9799 length:603 start_codon:yes stop_codon:yes gene_type:complete
MNIDPYEILGVSRDSTDSEIKKAYRKLAAKHHPDRGGSEQQFKKINEAYSLISTEEKRQEQEYSHADIFGDIFSNFGDVFQDLFGNNQRRSPHRVTKDEEITFDFRVSLSQIKSGVSQMLHFERNIKCKPCNGQGGKHREVCKVCGGRGIVITRIGPLMQQTSCNACYGTGSSFKERCSSCHGLGVVKVRDSVVLNIKQA